MNYQEYLAEIEERKTQGLSPKPIDGSDLLAEIISQIKDANHPHRKQSVDFFIYNTIPGTTTAAEEKAAFLKQIISGEEVVEEISLAFAFELLSHMKGGPSVRVMIDLTFGDDVNIARQAAEVLKTQVFLYEADTDTSFEEFVTNLMEYVDLRVEDLGERRYLFKPEYGHVDSLPGLDPEGMMATFDRTDALNRDDIHFFTPDHPLLRSSLDSLLSSEKGNATLSVYQGAESPGIFLQVTFLVLAKRMRWVSYFRPPVVRSIALVEVICGVGIVLHFLLPEFSLLLYSGCLLLATMIGAVITHFVIGDYKEIFGNVCLIGLIYYATIAVG